MKEQGFSVEEIKELMQAMSRNALSKLKVESGDYKISIEGKEREVLVSAVTSASVVHPVGEAPAVPAERPQPKGTVVTSPIVGTFYAAASPAADPFVKPGTAVKKGDVLFIIESMKLMNEVTSQHDGIVSEILVENGQGVEYGQPILAIE